MDKNIPERTREAVVKTFDPGSAAEVVKHGRDRSE